MNLNREYTNNYSENLCNNKLESIIQAKISGIIIESRKHDIREKERNSKYYVIHFVKNEEYNKKLGIANIKIKCDSNLIKSIALSISGTHFDRFYPYDMRELIPLDLSNKTIIPITNQDITLFFECDDDQNIEVSYDIVQIDNSEILRNDILIPFRQILTFGTEKLYVKNNIEIIDVKYKHFYDGPLESVRLVTNQKIKNIVLVINNETIHPTYIKDKIYLFDTKNKKVNDIQKIIIYNDTNFNNFNELNIHIFAEIWNICVLNENGCNLLFSK